MSTYPSLFDTTYETEVEEWRDIPGFTGYQASSLGKIRSGWIRKGKGRKRTGIQVELTDNWWLVSLSRSVTGYLYFACHTGRKTIRVSKAVCLAFHGLPPFPEAQVAHFPDRDKANNRADNLMWASAALNTAHKKIHGTVLIGVKHWKARFTESEIINIRNLAKKGYTRARIARMYNRSAPRICEIVNYKTWKHLP